jgi:Ring finger domain
MTIPCGSSRRRHGDRRSRNSGSSSTRTQAFCGPLWEYLSYVTARQQIQAYFDAETVMAHSSRRQNEEHNAGPPGASIGAISCLPSVRVLPIHKKIADETLQVDKAECGICCERLVDGVALTRLPCGHVFHITCGVQWLQKSCTCPECRYELPTNDPVFEIGRRQRMKDRKTFVCNCKPCSYHTCFFDTSSAPVGPQPPPVEELSSDGERSGVKTAPSASISYESPVVETMNEATCCYFAQL